MLYSNCVVRPEVATAPTCLDPANSWEACAPTDSRPIDITSLMAMGRGYDGAAGSLCTYANTTAACHARLVCIPLPSKVFSPDASLVRFRSGISVQLLGALAACLHNGRAL